MHQSVRHLGFNRLREPGDERSDRLQVCVDEMWLLSSEFVVGSKAYSARSALVQMYYDVIQLIHCVV